MSLFTTCTDTACKIDEIYGLVRVVEWVAFFSIPTLLISHFFQDTPEKREERRWRREYKQEQLETKRKAKQAAQVAYEERKNATKGLSWRERRQRQREHDQALKAQRDASKS